METMKHTVIELLLEASLVLQEPSDRFSRVSTRVHEEAASGMSMIGFKREEITNRIGLSLKQVCPEGLEDWSPFELSGESNSVQQSLLG
jgi:energy-coupling factor transporter ATP-binding protein EcfA2